MTFQPLATQRAIRDDSQLSSTQKHLLHVATLRATSKGAEAGRVRASLAMLAADAGVSAKSAERTFKHDQEQVLSYFRRVVRCTRQTQLWFHLTPDTESAVTPDTESAIRPDSGLSVPDSGHRVRPSASTSATSKQPAPAPTRPGSAADLAERLAATQEWPLDHCHKALETKRTELAARPGVRNPDALLARIVNTSPHELQAPPPPRPRVLNQCSDSISHERHDWADRHNRFVCMGREA